MASPQKENGYTPIANEILEALALHRISGEQWQILVVIFRKTYGFHKKEDKIALSQFYESTGMKKPSICRALNSLVSMNIVSKDAKGMINTYSLQKDFDKWHTLAKKLISKNANNRLQKSKSALAKMLHTKDTITKDNTKDTSKTGVLQGKQYNELIDSFKEVNPMYTDFYKNTTERRALEEMASKWGYDKLLSTIRELPKIIGQPYAPKITTPNELRRGIGKLVAFYNQEKNKLQGKKREVIL